MKEIISHNQQNLLDLTAQTLGSVEHLYDFCMENGVSPTKETISGKKFTIPEGEFETEIVNYLNSKGISIATGTTQKLTLFEPGLFEPGLFA